MQHLLVSDSVPPWMKSSTVVEAMAKGPSQWLGSAEGKSWENPWEDMEDMENLCFPYGRW